MREEQFIKVNSKTWKELETFSSKINSKGIKSLNSNEVKNFLHLFRQCSHHLAYSRTHFSKSRTTVYLNALVGKCQSHVYGVKKISFRAFFKYISYEFPKLLKAYKWYLIASFGIFILGFLVSSIAVLYDSNNANLFISSDIVNGMKQGGKGGSSSWNSPLMSSYIMTNNITVAIKAFVFGITVGIGTIHVLFFNGIELGSLTALIYMYGDPKNYWSLILPHGIIELTAIFIAGAAGLIIAKSMLIPGKYSRKYSIINGAKAAVSLVMGVVLMLIIAGTIEGFFTPLKISESFKLAFAFVTFILLCAYFSIPYIKSRTYK